MKDPAGADSASRVLQRQLSELEREYSQARDRAQMLDELHRSFAAIASTCGPQEVVERTLRAAREPLGFSRGFFFGAAGPPDSPGLALRGGELIETAGPDRPLADRDFDVGTCADLSAPLVDCRGWYVVARLAHAGRTHGSLYVDGHAYAAPREPQTSLVRALAAIAAVAIDNITLVTQLHELAERDPLTGLLNRRAFSSRSAAEIERCKREGRCAAFVLVDVDDFKSVNDSRGHAFGDTVLTRVARTLTRCSRPQDVVARFAGDEFVVFFTGVDAALAYALVARLSSQLRSCDLKCSIGAALYPHAGDGADALFLAADRALYRTKTAGKNGFAFE
jgi:diguanylate cyclase (GGDEF)-like protein